MLGEAVSIAQRIGHPNEQWRVHAVLVVLGDATGDGGSDAEHRETARAIPARPQTSRVTAELADRCGKAGDTRLLLGC